MRRNLNRVTCWEPVGPRVDAKGRPVVIDLFAGAGGLSLGAVRAGFDIALAVDADCQAITTHLRNFPGYRHLAADIGCLSSEHLLAYAEQSAGRLDGLIGGPPCQGFSVIGHRNATDRRNHLFVTFFELVSKCQPAFFVAENVPGILAAQYDDVREAALDHVRGEFTLLEPIRLRASEFGVPTVRERVFFIGYRPDRVRAFTSDDILQRQVPDRVCVADALHGLPRHIRSTWLTEEQSWRRVAKAPEGRFWTQVVGNIPEGVGDPEALRRFQDGGLVSGCFGTRHSPEVQARYGRLGHGEKDQVSKSVRLRPDGLCPTLRAGTGFDRGRYQAVRPIHPTAPRVITPREAARLQGFPDWFRFAPCKWHSFRQIGNSVCPTVAESVLSLIRNRLEGACHD